MKERNYGIDLLKIVLAFMVIIIHINANGTGQVLAHATLQPWKSLITVVTFLCYPAVNTYILVTGYYLYDIKKNLKSSVRSLSLLWLSVLFFSVFGYFVGVVFGNGFQTIELIKRFFPITRGVWWFYTVYFALVLISPFINKMIDAIDMWEHKMALLVLILILSILPGFVNWEGKIGSNYGYSLIWFIALYITGAYLKRRKIMENRSTKRFFLMMLIFGAATIALYLVPKILSLIGISISFAMYNSIFVYTQAIALFITFGNISIPKALEKTVASISRLALASYLLHCQEDIEKILWLKLNPSAYSNSVNIIFITVLLCIAVFVIGILLEAIRKKLCSLLKIDKGFVGVVCKGYSLLENALKEKASENVRFK